MNIITINNDEENEGTTLWTKSFIHSFTDGNTAILTKLHEFLNKALSLEFYYLSQFHIFNNMTWADIIA